MAAPKAVGNAIAPYTFNFPSNVFKPALGLYEFRGATTIKATDYALFRSFDKEYDICYV